MVPFRYTGQHPMVFEVFGEVAPDEVLNVGDQHVEAFRHRSDLECLDFDALAEHVALRESDSAEVLEADEIEEQIEDENENEPEGDEQG